MRVGGDTVQWRFDVLGPVVVTRDGEPVPIGGPRQRGLLAYLLINADRVVTTAQLVDALWGESPPATATKSVQVFVSRLRRDLGPDGGEDRIETHAKGYRLMVDADESVLTRLADLLDRARSLAGVDPHAAAATYADAARLWRGVPLADVGDAPFAGPAAAVLDDLRVEVVEGRAEAQLALGRQAEAIPDLQRAVDAHPLRERLCALLAVALYRSGRHSEALDVIRDVRRRLAEELGLDAGPQLRELEQRVLRHDAALLDPVTEPSGTGRPVEREVPDGSVGTGGGDRRRRTTVAAALVAAVVVAAVVVVTLVVRWPSRHDPAAPLGSLVAGSLAVIDPAGHVVTDVPVGSAPGPVAVSGDSAWVGDLQDHTVTQIDLARGSVVKRYGLPSAPVSMTALGDQIWIGDGFEGTLSKILVPDQQLSAPFFPDRRVAGLLAVTAGPDRLWVGLADRTVLELDPHNLRVEAATDTASRVGAMAPLGAAVVAIPMIGSEVLRIDPSGATRRLATLKGRPVSVTTAFGSVWVATTRPDRLVQLAPLDGAVRSVHPLAAGPSAVIAGDRALWVVESDSGIIEHVPLVRSAVATTLRVGHPIGGVAADGRYVCVAVRGR